MDLSPGRRTDPEKLLAGRMTTACSWGIDFNIAEYFDNDHAGGWIAG
jgi:hypothetical protein